MQELLVLFRPLVAYWCRKDKCRTDDQEVVGSTSGYQVVSTWMGDCLRTDKPSRYVTSHQGQLSLAIPPCVGAMSTGESWGVYIHRAMHQPSCP